MPDEKRGNIEIRRDPDGSLDEIVATNVTIHLEKMDDNVWWMGIYDDATGGLIKPGTIAVMVNFATKKAYDVKAEWDY